MYALDDLFFICLGIPLNKVFDYTTVIQPITWVEAFFGFQKTSKLSLHICSLKIFIDALEVESTYVWKVYE